MENELFTKICEDGHYMQITDAFQSLSESYQQLNDWLKTFAANLESLIVSLQTSKLIRPNSTAEASLIRKINSAKEHSALMWAKVDEVVATILTERVDSTFLQLFAMRFGVDPMKKRGILPNLPVDNTVPTIQWEVVDNSQDPPIPTAETAQVLYPEVAISTAARVKEANSTIQVDPIHEEAMARAREKLQRLMTRKRQLITSIGQKFY